MSFHQTKTFPKNTYKIDILSESENLKNYIKSKTNYKGEIESKIKCKTNGETKDETKDESPSEQQSSFFILDLAHIALKHNQWKQNLPKIDIFYAVKCLSDDLILKFLAELGCGFDCASKGEIDKLIDVCGVAANRIIYSHPCKQLDHLIHAKTRGVNATTFDSTEELEKIKLNHPKAEVVLRIKTEDKSSVIQFSRKFGAGEAEFQKLIGKCRELDLNLTGVSFHVGTGSFDTRNFAKAIEVCAKVFSIAENFGFKLSLLDIGGGFPGSDSAQPSFEDFAVTIKESIERCFNGRNDIRIIAEPGRYFVEGCIGIVAKIVSRKVLCPDALRKEARELEKLLDLKAVMKAEKAFAKAKEDEDKDENEDLDAEEKDLKKKEEEDEEDLEEIKNGKEIENEEEEENETQEEEIETQEEEIETQEEEIETQEEEIETQEDFEERKLKETAKPKYFISESTALSFSNALFEDRSYEPLLVEDHKGEQLFESYVYGNTGCNYELIASNVKLPLLNLNEFVFFENMGAYSISIAKGMRYNGYSVSKKIFYCWRQSRLNSVEENYEQYLMKL